MFAGNFAPRGWALCDGQLIAVSQNDALFSLLGTIYGGDGRTTFGLPELRGRIPIHAGSGTGPGLSPRPLGQRSGSETVTVTQNQLPAHSHRLNASTQAGTEGNPDGHVLGQTSVLVYSRQPNPQSLRGLHPSSVPAVGGSQPHTNLQPFLCVNYIIALFGVYPSRQ